MRRLPEDAFEKCRTCGHYQAEHEDGGPCACDVLQTRVLGPSAWARCACAGFVPAAASE